MVREFAGHGTLCPPGTALQRPGERMFQETLWKTLPHAPSVPTGRDLTPPQADGDALSHTPTAAHGVLGTRGSPNNPHKAKTPADWPLASSPYAVVKVPREMTSPLREMPSCWICELPGPGTHTGSSSKAGGPECPG